MMRKYLYPLIIIMACVFFYFGNESLQSEYIIGGNLENDNKIISASEFSDSDIPTSTTGVIVKHQFYTLSYSETHEQSEWVAYELSKKHLSNNNLKRPYFIEDKNIKTKSADWRNYKNSGYDRGHLCPAGDRKFSLDAYNETFLTSNISPQLHEFNAGIWNRLEEKVRFWADKFDGVYVVTGGVLKDGLKKIGTEQVSVPDEFYKIVVDASDGNYKAVAFLIPNATNITSFYDYVVTIDFIEEKTGIDFFSNLSEKMEQKMEATIDLKSWGKR